MMRNDIQRLSAFLRRVSSKENGSYYFINYLHLFVRILNLAVSKKHEEFDILQSTIKVKNL